MFVDLLIVLLLILALYKCKFFKFNEFNSDSLNIKNTDSLKAIFSIVVVFCHLTNVVNSGRLFWIFDSLGTFAVAVFLFISGYGLMKQHITNDNYANSFIYKRLLKILIPYLIVLFVYILFYLFSGYDFDFLLNKASRIFETGDSIVANSWYVFLIIGLYVIFDIVCKLFKKNYKVLIFSVLIIVILYIALAITLKMCLCWYVTVFSFVYGIVYSYYEKQIGRIIKNNFNMFLIIFTVLLIILFAINIKFFDMCNNIFFYILKYYVFVSLIIVLMFKIEFNNIMLDSIHKISYELYLVHGLSILLFENCRFSDFTLCLLVLFVSIIMSYCLNKTKRVIIKRFLS